MKIKPRSRVSGPRSLSGLLLAGLLLGPGPSASGQVAALYTFDAARPARIHDMSGHGHHLTPGASPEADEHDPAFTTDTPFPGVSGNHALRFDGVDDFVRGPGFFAPDRAFGLELRFKRVSADLAHPQVLVSTRGFKSGGFEVRLERLGGIVRLVFEWWDQTGVPHAHTGGYITLIDHWYKLTVIHDYDGRRTQTILGLDGLAIGIHTVGGPRHLAMDPAASTVLGSNVHGAAGGGTAGVAFEGGLDEVRFVYGRLPLESILTRRFRSETAHVTARGPRVPGTSVHLDLTSDHDGNAGYVLLASLGLTAPGVLPGSDARPVPVGVDPLTLLAIGNLPPFADSVGRLDRAGRATARLDVPAVPALTGLTIGTGFLVLDPGAPTGIRRVSTATAVTLGG